LPFKKQFTTTLIMNLKNYVDGGCKVNVGIGAYASIILIKLFTPYKSNSSVKLGFIF